MHMSVIEDFDKIMEYAHFWNWAPDWHIAKEIYLKFPDSYSVLTPFAYTYLEEMIRTTTSDYGIPPFNQDGQPNKVRVGMSLIALAIDENKDNIEYINALECMKKHFTYQEVSNEQNGRNRVMHGHIHPRFWSKEVFESLIHEIASLSKYSMF